MSFRGVGEYPGDRQAGQRFLLLPVIVQEESDCKESEQSESHQYFVSPSELSTFLEGARGSQAFGE
jgi:hypothetical protein